MKGEKINLRAVELHDASFIFRLENDTSLWLVSNTSAPFSAYTIEQYVIGAAQDIYAARQLRLIIETADQGTSEQAGTADIFEFEPRHRRAGIGIALLAEMRGRGYAREALSLLLDYCYNVLNLHQVWCNILADNKKSLSLFTSAGFSVTGTRREWVLEGEIWRDEHILQRLR